MADAAEHQHLQHDGETKDSCKEAESKGATGVEEVDAKWLEMYQKFKEEVGQKLGAEQEYNHEDKSLRAWAQEQRRRYRDGTLQENLTGMLKQIGFIFYLPAPDRQTGRCYSDIRWLEHYEKLKAFKEEHGHACVPKRYKSLGRWVSKQRKYGRNGTLRQDHKELLDQVGFLWDARPAYLSRTNDARWPEQYEMLKAFKAKNGHTSVPLMYKRDPSLAGWVGTQQQLCKRGMLQRDHIKMLNVLGDDVDEVPERTTFQQQERQQLQPSPNEWPQNIHHHDNNSFNNYGFPKQHCHHDLTDQRLPLSTNTSVHPGAYQQQDCLPPLLPHYGHWLRHGPVTPPPTPPPPRTPPPPPLQQRPFGQPPPLPTYKYDPPGRTDKYNPREYLPPVQAGAQTGEARKRKWTDAYSDGGIITLQQNKLQHLGREGWSQSEQQHNANPADYQSPQPELDQSCGHQVEENVRPFISHPPPPLPEECGSVPPDQSASRLLEHCQSCIFPDDGRSVRPFHQLCTSYGYVPPPDQQQQSQQPQPPPHPSGGGGHPDDHENLHHAQPFFFRQEPPSSVPLVYGYVPPPSGGGTYVYNP